MAKNSRLNVSEENRDDAERIINEIEAKEDLLKFANTKAGSQYIKTINKQGVEAITNILNGDHKSIETLRVIIGQLKVFKDAKKEIEIKQSLLDSMVDEYNETIINTNPRGSYTSM